MNFQLISSIIRGKWAIDPMYAMNAAGFVADLMNGTIEVESSVKPSASRKMVSNGGNSKRSGTVGVINLSGPLMKNDQECGPAGMSTIEKWIKAFDRDHEIDAIVLKIDSPGGTVDGTESLANVVKSVKKPVVTYVDGLMASAALWIGSAADEVFASSDLDEVGSIGVVLEFADMQPAYEKLGVKFHTIVASQSPDKRKMWEDLRAGNYEDYRAEFLDPVAERFQQVVKQNRQKVEDKHMTGKVYSAKNVMGVFVDRIGTFEDAIDRAIEMAEQKIASGVSAGAAINTEMKYAKLMGVLGADSLEFEADGRRTFTPEEMEALEAALDQPAPEATQDENVVEELNATISEKENEIAELKAQVEALKNAPGATVTETAEATDAAPVGDPDEALNAEFKETYNKLMKKP